MIKRLIAVLFLAFVSSSAYAVNVTSYGATPSDSLDDTAAFQAAVNAAIASGTFLEMPCGRFLISAPVTASLPAGATLAVRGQSKGCTFIESPNGSGFVITYGSQYSQSHWRDFAMLSGTRGGTAIRLVLPTENPNAALGANSSFDQITFRGADGHGGSLYWARGIDVSNVSLVDFTNIDFTGSGDLKGNPIYLAGKSATSHGVEYNITNFTFTLYDTGLTYGNYLEGVTIANGNFQRGNLGIHSPYSPHPTAGGAQLNVVNVQFGQHVIAGIYQAAPISSTTVANCVFIQEDPGSYGAVITGSHSTVTGSIFTSNGNPSITGLTFGTVAGSGTASIVGNSFSGFETAIWLQSSTYGIVVNSNSFSANTNNVVNHAGAANKVGLATP